MKESDGEMGPVTALAKRGEQAPERPVYFRDLPAEEQIQFLIRMLRDQVGEEEDGEARLRRTSSASSRAYDKVIPSFLLRVAISVAVIVVYLIVSPVPLSLWFVRFNEIFVVVGALLAISAWMNISADVIEDRARIRLRVALVSRIKRAQEAVVELRGKSTREKG